MLSPATVRLLVFVFFYVLFLAIGAYVFSAIEAPAEAARVRELKELRREFLYEHKCVKGILIRIEYYPIYVCTCTRNK